MHKPTVATWALVLGLALAVSPVRAQEGADTPDDSIADGDGRGDKEPSKADDLRARELFMVGKTLYEGGRYASALELFEEAYELSPRPVLLLSLASTYERLERNEDALNALKEYLPASPKEKRDAIEKRIANLEALHDSAADRPLQRPSQAPVVVAEGAQDPPEPSTLGTWGWVTIGVGAAVGIAGGTLTVLGELDHRDVVDDPNMLQADAQVLVDSGDDKKMLGYLIGGAGGAILTSGLIMVLLAPDTGESDGTSVSATFVPGPESATFAVVGRF